MEGAGTIGDEPFGEVWLMPDEGPQPAVASPDGARLFADLRAHFLLVCHGPVVVPLGRNRVS